MKNWLVSNYIMMHPNVNPEMVITRMPFSIMEQLSGYLDIPDASNKPYWKALIAVIPGDIYTDIQINRFSMEGLRLNGGSSALSLLRDLGNRHAKTVRQLSSYLNKLHYEAPLKLIKPPEPLEIIIQPISSSVVDGEVATFTCEARGFPYPRYQWYRAFTTNAKGGNIIYEEVPGEADAILEISQVSLKNAGGYCCKIYHMPSGQEISKFTEWAYLTVLQASSTSPVSRTNGQPFAPPVIREQPDANVRIDLGRELVLTCRASGCPKPEYQWYKCLVDPSAGTTTRELLKGCTSDILQFAQAAVSDTGQYVCQAYNKVGEEWSITVTVSIQTMTHKRCRIEIFRHPTDVTCLPGMDQKMECVASCATAKLYYQWFKDDQSIEGETTSQLCFDDVKLSDAGVYFCRVTTEDDQSQDSQRASLQVPHPMGRKKFTARDKVALLIGNEDYRSAGQLVAPGNDMNKLAQKLHLQLNFKVVSLLNLSLLEMRKALSLFCDLLNHGVYGLFYFSGHGFEHGGLTYMVPTDAATGYLPEECMCAQEVLDKMQRKNTALNVILLDICRKLNENAHGPAEKYNAVVKGNTVFGYAAQCNSEAFEVKSAGYAIFTKYLVKHIHEDENIFLLLYRILEDVKKDPDAGNKQFPALMGDLNESRSLMDEISYRGHTQEFTSRHLAWQNGHELPQDMYIPCSHGIMVRLNFELGFSNVMHVGALVLDRGAAENCEAKLGCFPTQLGIKVYAESIRVQNRTGNTEMVRYYKTMIQDIQKLTEDLQFRLIVTYIYQGQTFNHERIISVDRPLISQAWLLEEECERAPTENDEYRDSPPNSLLSGNTNSSIVTK